ncbi:CRISPR-associated endonuclease Cas2 [Synechococcus sp. PCC 7336]|uniref:CRISPR-associated endonuclease Cas2 n=1 Tax=Synechococcus sp. PCC 7336 TaxID=195250 RepID=UPI000346D9A1|nr:CRISPR-associated endonuclease Cas2 [Synechococcus sp. PCC 7336]
MAEPRHWYLVCYDIRDPKRWRKVFKLLKGYGESLQLSIFRCRLNLRERERLRWELEEIMAAEDSLLVVGLCNRCVERIQVCNCPEAWPVEEQGFQIF